MLVSTHLNEYLSEVSQVSGLVTAKQGRLTKRDYNKKKICKDKQNPSNMIQ